MTLIRYGTIFLVAAGVVWLPALLVALHQVYVLGIPDSKFGDEGFIAFVGFVWGIAAGVTGLVAMPVYGWHQSRQSFPRSVVATATGAAVMSVLSVFLARVPPFMPWIMGEVGGMATSWALVSASVLVGAHVLVQWRRNPTSGSSGRSPLRGARR